METPLPPDPNAPGASPPVAALIVTRRPGDLGPVVGTVDGQVYEPASIFVVSAEPDALQGVREGIRVAASIPAALAELSPDHAFIWLVDQDARPRPDALGALVATAEQVDASVVGSKILKADHRDELISVGEATDVFGHPYSGLEAGERDQEQYDVIRDVAFVESASVLVRRDLAIGLGGLDTKVPYLASGIDFCQRARVAGGRVVIAPSSEVLYEGYRGDRALTWREQAGRIRASLKVYSPLTLLWSIPGLALIGLILGLYRTFNGRPLALVDWMRAWAWNVLHLPNTLAERTRTRRSRQAGDEELFRYQVRGSVELRAVASELGALIQDESESEDLEFTELFEQTPGFWQQPAFLASLFGVVFVLFFTRSLWSDGMPVIGYALPLAENAWDVLRSYAGGWHLAGLGSPEPMHPAIGATAAVQFLTRLGPAMAATGLTIGSVALGIGGTVRLLRRARIGQIPRYGAAVIAVAGPAALAVAGEGYWPAVLAMGTLPWALAGALEPLPASRRALIGRLARLMLAMGWAAAMVPALLLAPVAFGLVWSLAAARFAALWRGALIGALGIPFVFPWMATQRVSTLVEGGEPIHLDMSWWTLTVVAVAALTVMISGSGPVLRTGGLGAVLAAGGALLARSGSLGIGLELTAAGAVVAGIGMAMVVGAAADGRRGLDNAGVIRRSIAGVAMAAGYGAMLLTLSAVPAGRAGLPADRLGEALAFASSRAEPHGADRILMMGQSEQLPGEVYRLEDGTAYRLISGPGPTFPQAWLPDRRLGDETLEATIERLMTEVELRPGAAFAPFGIKWLVFADVDEEGVPASPLLEQSLTSQLDLRPLPQLDLTVLENELDAPRAETEAGNPWSYETVGYVGPAADTTVLIKENADARWGPGEWEQADWANRLGAEPGLAVFGGVPPLRSMAQAVGILALVALAAAIWGRPPAPEPDTTEHPTEPRLKVRVP